MHVYVPPQFHSSGCKMDDFPTFVSTREEALSLKKRFEIKSGIRFVRSSDYSANNEHGVNIRFVDKQKVVRNNDHPFSIVHTDTYECMYGRERHAARKQRIAAERELCLLEDHPVPLKRAYKKCKASRKKGCPAKLFLKEVVMYTDYKLDGPLTEATNWQKKVVSRDLRAALDKKIEIKEEVRVYLKYPTDEEHQSVHQVEQNHIEETPMFDPVVLEKLKTDFESTSKVSFNPPISPANPGNNLRMRPLHISDYDKGYLQLLAQLTTVGNVPRKLFEEQFHAYKACPNSYYIVVIEDIITGEVVATGTLGIDFKFTHMCSQRGKLDEIVVKEEYRGKQLGKLMVETLTLLSQQVGCYKTTLECKTENIPFYSKFGYEKDPENYMSYRHEHCSLNKEEIDS